MRVSDLEGALLDYWAAHHDPRCAGLRLEWRGDHWVGIGDIDGVSHVCCVGCAPGFRAKQQIRNLYREFEFFRPSCDWGDGGPIIESRLVSLLFLPADSPDRALDKWVAFTDADGPSYESSSPLVAAMRAYVASQFGDEVPDVADSEPGLPS